MSKKKSNIKFIYAPLDESKIEVIDIVRAEYVGGYKIHLWFSDGRNHVVDFEPFLMSARNPMSTPYCDVNKFRQFRLVYGNLDWNDCGMCIGVEISDAGRQKLEALARQFGYGE